MKVRNILYLIVFVVLILSGCKTGNDIPSNVEELEEHDNIIVDISGEDNFNEYLTLTARDYVYVKLYKLYSNMSQSIKNNHNYNQFILYNREFLEEFYPELSEDEIRKIYGELSKSKIKYSITIKINKVSEENEGKDLIIDANIEVDSNMYQEFIKINMDNFEFQFQ